MSNRILSKAGQCGTFAVLTLSLVVMAGCASSPESPEAAADARQKLEEIKNDPKLADRAPASMREAEEAVSLAEKPLPESESERIQHRVYMAEQKVAIARADAEAAYLEAQRKKRAEQRSDERLASRTDEVKQARKEKAELQQRIDEMQAKSTDRGIVLTLGDVLFTSGSASLQRAGYENLNKLAAFMAEYPERDAVIEGHTDSVGPSDYNEQLSQRRADSVKNYLARQGVAMKRLDTRGMGESSPVATNDTDAGREQNRRVEIIIDNPKQ